MDMYDANDPGDKSLFSKVSWISILAYRPLGKWKDKGGRKEQ